MCANAPLLRERPVNFAVLHASPLQQASARLNAPALLRVARLFLVLAVLDATPTAWAITSAPSWKPRETVTGTLADYVDHYGADRALAYDHHGNPGIAFFDNVDSDLRYARRVPGVGWVHTVVDDVGTVGQYPSLAYDRYERPAISYLDSTPNNDLKYAHFDGTTWNIETVDSGGGVGYFSSLAFDLLGRAAIAYHDSANGSLKYVADTDGDFSFLDETPVTAVDDLALVEGFHASLVFDPLNRPMIAHTEQTNADLLFSVEEPGIGWITTIVDDAGFTGTYPSIGIDPDSGYPAIACQDNSAGTLRYATWDGNAWNLTTVDSGVFTGESPSLAFDPADGNPAIAYFDEFFTNRDLRLAWHDGSTWQTQTVDAVGDVGAAPSLAFNDFGTGFPSMSYFDLGSTLYFIEDPPATVPEPATMSLLAIGLVGILSARRVARPESSMGVAELANTTPFAKPQGVPPHRKSV